MFPPMQWLLRAGGVLPRNSKWDKYFSLAASTCIGSSLTFATCHLYWEYKVVWFAESLYCVNDILYSVSGLLYLVKVHYSKKYFIILYKKCMFSEEDTLNSRKDFEVFLVILFGSIYSARLLSRSMISHKYVMTALYDVGMIMLTIPTVLQVVMIHHLKARFSTLNSQLREKTEAIQTRPLTVGDLDSAFRKHVLLLDLKSRVNNFFGPLNLLFIACRGVFNILLLYHTLDMLRNPSWEIPLVEWFIVLLVVTVIVSHCNACFVCSEEAKETVRIAHSIVDRDTPVEIMDEIEDFSLTMFNNPVKFSAGGVVNLDRGLITKVTLATVTCLIIAIQLTDLKVPHTTSTTNTTVSSVFSTLTDGTHE